MKKILFSLVALVCGMSMNAQVMKVMKDGVEVAKYYGADFEFVFEEASGWSTGSAKRTGNIDVNWVQLWENGPKFAEYNVGAENNKAEDYGGYYVWGGSQDKVDDHNTGTVSLSPTSNPITDTATKLWGSNWRMPNKTELIDLLSNCDVEWIDGSNKKYNNTNVSGLLCTGKGAYASNSVFLPAAGHYFCYDGISYGQGDYGAYWSSTPYVRDYSYGFDSSFRLRFDSGGQYVDYYERLGGGYSVRAVLNEPTTGKGIATATIDRIEVDVNWVQLWAGGPKFADRNVGSSNVKYEGSTMTFTDATKADAAYVWGANWCTPSKADMEHLMTAAQGQTDEMVKCEYTKEGSNYGFKFTGLTDGYTGNSVFFPAERGDIYSGQGLYWSATANDSEAWSMDLSCYYGLISRWVSGAQDAHCLVRPVLKN